MTTATHATSTTRTPARAAWRTAKPADELASAPASSDPHARALELARQHGYHKWGPARTRTWTLDAAGQLVGFAVRVPSSRASDQAYTVVYQILDGREVISCDCQAGQYNRPCWHAGCGVAAGRYVARLAALGWPED